MPNYVKYSVFNHKHTYAGRGGKHEAYNGKCISKQGIDIVSEKAEKLDLFSKDFELIIFKMFNELKENTSMVSNKTENINNKIEIIRKNQTDNLMLKST